MSGEIRLRAARPPDAARIALVQVEAWRDTYPTLLPSAYLAGRLNHSSCAARWQRSLAQRRPGEHLLVCEIAGAGLVGYASGGPARDASLGFAGEVYELYVLTDARERGIGRRLLVGLAACLLADGRGSGMVEVLAGNPARFFYEAMGARAVANHTHRFAGEELAAVIYGWQDLEPLTRVSGTARRA